MNKIIKYLSVIFISGEIVYILVIKIYRDRPKRLLDLSQNTYMDNMFKHFNTSDSKKKILILDGTYLSKTRCSESQREA
jgi:hypothetical protein